MNLNAQRMSIDKSDLFYQIAPIYDFKQSIVSLTFDDGYEIQFNIGIPILKERNLTATFYVITGRLDSVSKSSILHNISKEFEIGSHTVTHPDLIKIGNIEASAELMNSKLFLKNNFGVNAGLTMSYPWGIFDRPVESIAKDNYLAARSTDKGYNSVFTPERYALRVQNFDKKIKSYMANAWIDYAIQNHLWLVEMIHGINYSGYSPVDSKVLIEHFDYIKEVDDKIWCSTVSNVIKYIDESKNARIECEVCNDTIYKIRINDFMDDSTYNQLLSLRIKVPDNWDSISISNAEVIKTEYYNKSKFIFFNALPDNQLVTIKPGLIIDSEKDSGIRLVYLGPNPFLDNFKLTLEIFDKSNLEIALYDLRGKLVIYQKEGNLNGVINFSLNTSGISNGVYFLRVTSNKGDFIVKKLVKFKSDSIF